MKRNNSDLINKLLSAKNADPQAMHNRANRLGRLKISRRAIVIAIIAAAVVIIAASLAVLLGEGDKDEPLTSADGSSATGTYSDIAPLRTGFLLALTETSREGLDFLAHMSVDSEENRIEIRSIDVGEYATVDSRTATLEDHFNSGGITQLRSALVNGKGIADARYIVCSEENLTYFLSAVDPITLTLEDDVNVNYGGISLTIEGGTKELTPDEMMKYLRYLTADCAANGEKLTEIFRLIAGSLFSADDSEKPAEIYTAVVNYLTTDITAMDIRTYLPTLNSLYENGAIDSIGFSVMK